MSNVSVYAATDPVRVEMIVEGVIYTTKCNSFADAMRIAQSTCKALGLDIHPAITEATMRNAASEVPYSTEEHKT